MNRPPTDQLLDDESEVKKIEIERYAKMANTITYRIQKEDHTFGALICNELLLNKASFAAYMNDHPFEHHIDVRVQTKDNTTPKDMMLDSLTSLSSKLAKLEESFQNALKGDAGHHHDGDFEDDW